MKRPIVPLVLAVLLLPFPLLAVGWSTVASDGSIDEASLAAYATDGAFLQHAAGSILPVVARYNVQNIFGALTDEPPWDNLELGYFDNAAGSAVSATLYRVEKCTGTRVALCTVTSIDSAVPTCRVCTFTHQMDYDDFVYYVEVTVTRNSSTLTPSARTLRLFD